LKPAELLEMELHVLPTLIRKHLRRGAMSIAELSDACNSSAGLVRRVVGELQAAHVNIKQRPDKRYHLIVELEPGGRSHTTLKARSDGWQLFGVTSDNHLGNKNERLDVLHKLYDIFEQEGVATVYNAGNMIDGECRFNKNDLRIFGMDSQIDYLGENFPQRKGIATYFITGDDHEGWYAQREAINIGEHMEDRLRRGGRTDLIYLSNVEHDVEFRHGSGFIVCRIMHPGGGSSYAYSYTSQKTVESFQGGEKPHILLNGHFHKHDTCSPRGVVVIQTGCTEDQTTFMRKKRLEAHVGGHLVWVKQSANGALERLRDEWIPFYDRGYYKRSFE